MLVHYGEIIINAPLSEIVKLQNGAVCIINDVFFNGINNSILTVSLSRLKFLDIVKDVTKTGNGERGTGNGSLGTSCQRKPPQKSKMAVQKTRERKKKTKKGIRALVEIRWGRNCKSDSHFTFTF